MSYLGPSVLNGKVRYVSVSQLERYDTASGGCARKWYFRYVQNIKEPEKKPQKLGQQIHKQLEHFLRTGEDVLGDVARAGKRFLPRPGSDLFVEFEFGALSELAPGGYHAPIESMLKAADVPVIGAVDLVHYRGEWVDDDGVIHQEPGSAEVCDWKSSKQIEDIIDPDTGAVTKRGWAKKPEQLAASWQMLGYASLALDPRLKTIRLSHGVFQTLGRRAAKKTSISLPVAQVSERWRAVDRVIEGMKSTAGEADVNQVLPNYAVCGSYGGCAYRDRCPRDPLQTLEALLGGRTMSLLDKVKARSVAAQPVPASDVAQEVERLKAEEAAIITPPDQPKPNRVADVPPCALCGTNLNAENASRLLDGSWKHVNCPKMSKATAPAPCTVSGQQELDTDSAVSKKYKCTCGEILKVKPQKLGDGKYYAAIPAHGASAAEPATSPTLSPAQAPASEPKKQAAPVPSGLVLYLDAVEDGITAQRLETYASELCRALEKQYNAADVRCPPAGSPLAYGGWKGALAALARATPPTDGAWSCSSGNEIGMVVFDALTTTAKRVVRGVK